MRIQFNTSLDDIVDSHLRLYRISDTARKRKWSGLLGAPILAALMWLLFPGGFMTQVIWAAATIVLYVIFYLSSYDKLLAKSVRKYFQETLGSQDKVNCEMEFDDRDIICRFNGTEMRFQWAAVTEIVEQADDFEIWLGKKGLVVVRHSYFSTPEEQRSWLEAARQRTEQSQLQSIV
ncbi:hypothetical protein GF420_08595 [candidate division GN15 bacterium]|nr:hypothetical protein [candidate division GN15 bacterium]